MVPNEANSSNLCRFVLYMELLVLCLGCVSTLHIRLKVSMKFWSQVWIHLYSSCGRTSCLIMRIIQSDLVRTLCSWEEQCLTQVRQVICCSLAMIMIFGSSFGKSILPYASRVYLMQACKTNLGNSNMQNAFRRLVVISPSRNQYSNHRWNREAECDGLTN